MMKKNQIIRRTLPLVLVIATTPAVHATVTGAVPPVAVTWVNIADTNVATLARDPLGVAIIPNVNFAKFDPPVVSQFSQGLAFKGWLTAPATPANDEGVWSTAPQLSSSGTPHIATLVLRKGDPVPPTNVATFGGASLNVENLQCASNDWTACMTNTSLGKVGIGFNSLTLHNLGESVTSAWSDIRPPVITTFSTTGAFAMWKRNTTPQSGVRHFPIVLPNTAGTPFWDTGLGGAYQNNQPPRIASPSINDGGWVAAYARDFTGVGAINNHIQLRNATGGLVGGAIVRELTPALTPVAGFISALARFGTIHNRLMANSDAVVAGSELVTWQMQTMRDPLVIPKTSLWCKHNNTYSCLAFQNQPAPDLPAGNTISSFYALHAVPDFQNPGDHWIFWGAVISPFNKVAIYRTHVSTVAGLPDLIASNVTGTCPVNLIVGGTHNISAIDRFFSVNIHGTVLFKAACVTAPAGQRQILVTADVLSGHSRKVRAQSGVPTAGVPVAGAFPPASNFQLATPDQGSCSRGQAIGTQWLAAKVLYSGGAGQGVFWAFQ